jgi:hypothetical protein
VPLHISRQGAVTVLSAGERRDFEQAWKAQHYVLFPHFFDAPLLEFVRSHVRAGEFDRLVHPSSGTETRMTDNPAIRLANFVMNAPALLEQVTAITGAPARHFHGRVYKLTPGTGEAHDWHDDVGYGRLLGVSVNLSETSFEGGTLQLRHAQRQSLFSEVANTGEGDCVVFRLGDDIEHRVLAVSGASPRIALAGWFMDGQSHLERLKAL